jgi:hypothetical protein
MTFVAIVELVAGIGIIGFWTMALLGHKVPEVSAGDRAIWFHVAAEYLMAAALVAGGLLLLLIGDEPWIRVLAGVAIGGMVYSTVNSPGYYAREGTWAVVGAFGVLTVVGTVVAVLLIVT